MSMWLPVLGFEGRYEVSDKGEVASLPTPTWNRRSIIAQVRNVARGGYWYVTLHRDGKQFSRKVHQIVCEAFHGSRPDGAVTRHLDGNPTNNVPSNLAWGTYTQNQLDTVAHGRHHNASKTHCIHGHPLSGENLGINKNRGGRFCRECARRAKRKYANRKKETA
jgi:NUMOD4 motif.